MTVAEENRCPPQREAETYPGPTESRKIFCRRNSLTENQRRRISSGDHDRIRIPVVVTEFSRRASPPHHAMIGIRLLLFPLGFLALQSLLLAADGRLLESRAVSFTAKALDGMAEREPAIRELLEATTLQRIVYQVDGLRVTGCLAQPSTPGPHPCLIWNRGGNREFGAWSDRSAAVVLARAASWGYLIVATQYRGNAGGEGREEFGGADLADVLALIPLLEALPTADASRLGIYGQSRGGMMTYLALAATDRFAAAAVDAGMADLADSTHRRSDIERLAPELIPDWAADRTGAIARRSAVNWPEKLATRTPILLLHGTADDRVDVSHARRMAAALAQLGRPHQLVEFEGGDHALSAHRTAANERLRAWFDAHLRGPGSPPPG